MKRGQRNAEHSQDSTDTRDWVLDDETKFIQYIAIHQAKGGQGMDFDKSFWVDAATEMAKQGAPKTADACQSKWLQIRKTFHVIDKLANVPGLSYSLDNGAGVIAESEIIWAGFIENTPRAKPFKTKGWPHYEILKGTISSKTRSKNVFDDIIHPTVIGCGPGYDKKYWDSMTAALDVIEFGPHSVPTNSVADDPTVPLGRYAFHPGRQPPLGPSNISSSDSSDDDDMWNEYQPPKSSNTQRNAPSASAESLNASLLHALDRFGEAIRKLGPVLGQPVDTPGTSTSFSVDPVPLRKQRAIIQVQKEDLEDQEILTMINLFQTDVATADSYLVIEKDSVRRLFLAQYLKK